MSYWTSINGTITVKPLGGTQAEKRYILETVLEHLPQVTGEEGDMSIHIVQKAGHGSSQSADEFLRTTNNLKNYYGERTRNGCLFTQDGYILVAEGDLRGRHFNQTHREFISWLCRLAKRIRVEDVLVNIYSDDRDRYTINELYAYGKMYEFPSFSYWGERIHESNWCEYLLWEPYLGMPKKLFEKYYDMEVEK